MLRFRHKIRAMSLIIRSDKNILLYLNLLTPCTFKYLNCTSFASYKTFNILSLDVVAGSIASYCFFSAFLQVSPSQITAVALGLAVWCIYTFDHLTDAKRRPAKPATSRHIFHSTHFGKLSVSLIMAAGLLTALLFRIDEKTLYYGIWLSFFVAAYFTSVHLLHIRKVWHKEFTVAFLYTLGVLTGPLSLLERSLTRADGLCIATFFHIALVNLLLFAFRESKKDRQAGFPSLVHFSGKYFPFLFHYTALQGVVCCLLLILSAHYSEGILMLGILGILWLLYHLSKRISSDDHFRMLGDGVFLLLLL